MFIVELKYTAELAEIDAHLIDHRNWLDYYYQRGVFLCSGPQNPRVGGVIIAAGVSKDELTNLLQSDPFAQYGVAEYNITEFKAVKVHPLLESYLES